VSWPGDNQTGSILAKCRAEERPNTVRKRCGAVKELDNMVGSDGAPDNVFCPCHVLLAFLIPLLFPPYLMRVSRSMQRATPIATDYGEERHKRRSRLSGSQQIQFPVMAIQNMPARRMTTRIKTMVLMISNLLFA